MFEMKSHFHFQTSMVQPLKFGNENVSVSQTLLGVCLFFHVGITIDPYKWRCPVHYISYRQDPLCFVSLWRYLYCSLGQISVRHWPILFRVGYSLSGKMSYCKISRSLEVARFEFRFFQSLWNLAGPSCQISERCNNYNTQSRGFETSRDLALRRFTA